jgi:Recombinase
MPRKLVIDEAEAETVRFIFNRYLEAGSLALLIEDLQRRAVVTRLRTLATGRSVGGVPFTTGPLAYLLENRMYLGELNHGANSYPGEHRPIVAREVFDAVQTKLKVRRSMSSFANYSKPVGIEMNRDNGRSSSATGASSRAAESPLPPLAEFGAEGAGANRAPFWEDD